MDKAELVRCAAEGVPWDVSGRDPEDGRRIGAGLVADLCLGRLGPLHPRGVHLVGASLDGHLDLAHATLSVPLRLDRSHLPDGLDLTAAELVQCNLRRCRIGNGVDATGLQARRVDLAGSTIENALRLDQSAVGSLGLDEIEILGDRRQPSLTMTDGTFATTVTMRRARITGAVLMNRSTVDGSLAMDGTEITGTDEEGVSLDIRAMHVRGSMFLRHAFTCSGAIRAVGTTIDGGLELTKASIKGVDAQGISFEGPQLTVGASVLAASGLVTAGAVRLAQAKVEGDVALLSACIEGAGGSGAALPAPGMRVGGSVRLDELVTAGTVRLSDGVVGGSVTLRGARIGAPVDGFGNSFVADGLQVGRSMHLNGGFAAEGEVRLVGAAIGGQLSFEGAVPFPVLALRGARCAELADTRAVWPAAGRLELRGFRFDALKLDAGWTERLDWIRRQGFTTWSPEPYEQLAAYYSATGDEDAARRIRIARNDDELTHLRTTRRWRSFGYRAWRRPLGWLVGYGYRRSRAAWLLAATLLAAGGVFHLAERDGAMVPDEPPAVSAEACGEAYPCFNSLVYGADVVLPIIDFGQDGAYRPIETTGAGPAWIWARWTFIAIGWTLASVVVAAFTGLVQRG